MPSATFTCEELGLLGLEEEERRLRRALKGLFGMRTRKGGAALLFCGPSDCGGMDLLLEVLKETNVNPSPIDWAHPSATPASIDKAFADALNLRKAVFTIEKFDSLVTSSTLARQIMSQIYHILNSGNNHFVVAFAPQPWLISKDIQDIFSKKILVKFPTPRMRSWLIEHYLRKIIQHRNLGCKYEDEGFLESVANLSKLQFATWADIEKCVRNAVDQASEESLASGKKKESSHTENTVLMKQEYMSRAAKEINVKEVNKEDEVEMQDFFKEIKRQRKREKRPVNWILNRICDAVEGFL